MFKTVFTILVLLAGAFFENIYSQEVVVTPEEINLEMVSGDTLRSSFTIKNNSANDLLVDFSLTQKKIDPISKEELLKTEEKLFVIATFFEREVSTWIYELSLDTGELLDSIPVPDLLGTDLGLAYDSGVLFYEGGGGFRKKISKYDIFKKELISNITVPEIRIQGLGIDQEYLYGLKVEHSFNQLIKIDRGSEKIVGTLPLEKYDNLNNGGLTNGGSRGTLFVIKNYQIVEVDKNTGKVIRELLNPNFQPISGAGYSESRGTLFIATLSKEFEFKNVIVELDPDTDTVINEFLLPQGGYGYSLASDENGLANFFEILPHSANMIIADSSVKIDFKVDASRLLGGEYLTEVVITNGESILNSLPIRIDVTGVPKLALDIDTLKFDDLYVGGSALQAITLKNEGSEGLYIEEFEFSSTSFSLLDSTFELPLYLDVNEVKTFQIKFSPDTVGDVNESLIIRTNFEDSVSTIITLQGAGIPAPEVQAGIFPIDYNMNVGENDSGSFIIKNIGEDILRYEIQSIPRSINEEKNYPRYFAFFSNESGKQELIEYSVSDRKIIHKFPGFDKSTFGFKGLAYDGQKIYTTTTIRDEQDQYKSYLITYDIEKEQIIDSLSLSGGENEFYTTGLTYNNSFLYVYSGNDNALITLNKSSGEYIDTLSFGSFFDENSNYYLSSQDFTSRGSRKSIFFSFLDVSGDDKQYIGELDIETDSVINLLEYPSENYVVSLAYSESEDILWTVSYSRLDGASMIGMNPSTGEMITSFPLQQEFENDTYFTSDEFSRGNFINFISSTKDSLLPLEEKIIEYQIDTKNEFGGVYRTEIRINSNDPLKPKIEITGIPKINIKDRIIDFGDVFLGNTSEKDFRVYNFGTDNLEVSSIEILGDGFTYKGNPSISIEPNNFKFIKVEFSPLNLGDVSGELMVLSNSPSDDSIKVDLKGAVVNGPTVEIDSTLFIVNLVQGLSTTKTISIENKGGSDLLYLVYPNQKDSIRTEVENYKAIVVLDTGDGGFSWGLNLRNHLRNGFSSIDFTFIEPEDLINTNISTYDVLLTVSDQQPPYEANIIQSLDKIESFLENGGDAFFSSASKGAGIILPGAFDEGRIVGEWSWDGINQTIDFEHPIMRGVDTLFFGGSRIHFTSIPNRVDTLAITPVSFHPTLIEYSYGFGNVIASGIAMEDIEANGWSNIYDNTLNYMFNGAKGKNWLFIEEEKNSVQINDSKEIKIRLSSEGLELGTYEADLILESNAVEKKETLLATIRLNVVLGTNNELLNDIPDKLELSQNYPNPFNPSTNIAYGLPEAGKVQIKVYNILGQQVLTLVDDFKKAGRYNATFDAGQLSSGVYFYRMTVDGQELEIKKMLLLK